MAYDVCMQSDEEIKAQKMAPKGMRSKSIPTNQNFWIL